MRKTRSALAEVTLTPQLGTPKTGKTLSPERTEASPQRPVPPRRGYARAWGGRAAVPPRPPVSRGSTAQVQGLYPWLHSGALPPAGAYIGVDCLTGGAFSCHPLAWLEHGLISNPNIVLTGLPGAGKSAIVKALALRLMPYGVRSFIAGDLKNEYAPLARAVGAEPVELGPGLPARLNPLDAGPLGEHLPSDPAQLGERLAEIHRRRLVLVCALAATRLGRGLSPTEEEAVSLAIDEASGWSGARPEGGGAGMVSLGGERLSSPTIPGVWALLRDPSQRMAAELRVRRGSTVVLREMIRPVTDALGAMIRGSLSGLFDAATTVRPDWDAPVQAIDLSRIAGRGDDTVAMVLACVSSWAQAVLDEPGPPRMVVRDELWRSLRVPALVVKTDSDLRLSRAQGTIQVLATHRLSDFEAAGPAGSAVAAIASGLIGSCDTRICLRQDTVPLNATREQIGLTDTECAHIGSWTGRQTGRAVWKIGRAASAVVQTVLTPSERALFWTNERMAVLAAMRGNRTYTRPGLAHDASDLVLLTALAIVMAAGAGTWLCGQVAALLFGGHWLAVSFPAAVQAALRLPGHLGDPRGAWPAADQPDLPGIAGFAVAALLTILVLAAAGVLGLRAWTRRQPQQGFASRAQLRETLAGRAVIARAPVVRPSLAGAQVTRVQDAGVLLGRAVPSGMPLACSAEDSVLLLAAPRTGKTSSVVIPWLHGWPGPALVTSIRPDVLLATAIPRRGHGPVAVMAPTGMISWPERLSWDLTSGCGSFDKARTRADVMVTVGKSAETSDSTDGGYFAMNATNLLAAWLHAAALSGGTARDVLRWAFDERIDAPIRILAGHSGAADGTAAMLDALYRLPADTTRASLWTTAQTAVAPLLAPAAKDAFIPAPGETAGLEEFLRAGGTLYLMADERRATALAPVVSAFADDFIETAKGIADARPGGRLDPPCGLFLDEVANIVPLPQLPALMSFAGGTGIFVVGVLQSMAQARNRWGHDAAAMLWGAATVKLILGGLAGEDLREISELAGEWRETVITWQRGQGGHSVSSALQDRKTLTPGQVRTLSSRRREALVVHATTPAARVRMTRHYEGPDRAVFAASAAEARRIAGLDGPRGPGQAEPDQESTERRKEAEQP